MTTNATKNRFPLLVVEVLLNCTHHFRELKNKLGRAPNARPFSRGVKFTTQDKMEYRAVQRYVTELEKTEIISWFCYSLPSERSVMVARMECS